MEKMISKITTKNYRNLVNEDGVVLNNLNILIGSNGSGKSNLVAILEFFKNCLTLSSDLESRGITAFENAQSKLGYNILDAFIDKPATVDFIFEFPYLHSSSGMRFFLSLFVDKSCKVLINEEMLMNLNPDTESGLSYYYRINLGSGMVSVKSDEHGGYSLKELKEIPMNELSLIAIPNPLIRNGILSPPNKVPFYDANRDLVDVVKKWQFYNANEMDLTKIRGERPKVGSSDVILAKSGENLPAVLDNLSNHIKYGIDFDERINNAMKEILPMTKRIKTSREGMSLTVRWYFDDMEEPFYLDDMSDGTVRMLCWATILHSPILPTLLVIDEPELSLHIAWMGILANWIKQASQKTQIIISTHSPDLLDYFTDCADDVICFEKTQPKGHFKAQKLPEAIIKDKIAEGWQLGDLYRAGDDIIGGWPW